jgi:hypothetical protein
MTLGTSGTYNTSYAPTGTVTSVNAAGKDGKDMTIGNKVNPGFWAETLGFNTGSSGLVAWNLSSRKQYPILWDLGGQE